MRCNVSETAINISVNRMFDLHFDVHKMKFFFPLSFAKQNENSEINFGSSIEHLTERIYLILSEFMCIELVNNPSLPVVFLCSFKMDFTWIVIPNGMRSSPQLLCRNNTITTVYLKWLFFFAAGVWTFIYVEWSILDFENEFIKQNLLSLTLEMISCLLIAIDPTIDGRIERKIKETNSPKGLWILRSSRSSKMHHSSDSFALYCFIICAK